MLRTLWWDRAMFTCALVLAAWWAVSLFRSPKGDFKAYLIPFVIFAACCVYLVMEVQPRYAYVGQIALFILMAGGVEALCSLAAGLLQKKKLPHKNHLNLPQQKKSGKPSFPLSFYAFP